jgi:hypothetical protein
MADHADADIVFACADPDRRARIEAEEGDGFWIVMHDVEGNEFCVI